jgi:hypothetical protein
LYLNDGKMELFMGGGGGSTTSTVNENPLPDWAAPNVSYYLSQANSLSLDDGGVFSPYTGVTYAARNVNEILGIDSLGSATATVHLIVSKGEALIRAVLDGTYVNVNPKLVAAYNARRDQMLDEFKRDALPNIHRNFRMLGRYGGASHHITQYIAAEKLSKEFADLALEIFGEDYILEVNRRMSMLKWAVPYGTEDIRTAEFHRQAGLYEREYIQGDYNNDYDIWKAEQVAATARLDILMNAIKAIIGLAPASTARPFYLPKTLTQVAGLALSGVGLFASIYGKARKDPGLAMNTTDYMNVANSRSDMETMGGGALESGAGGAGR